MHIVVWINRELVLEITAYQSHFSIGRFLVGNLDTGKQGSYLFF